MPGDRADAGGTGLVDFGDGGGGVIRVAGADVRAGVAVAGASLPDRLRAAVIDESERPSSKGARYRPQNPDQKPLGDPKLHVLTAEEKQNLRKIEAKQTG